MRRWHVWSSREPLIVRWQAGSKSGLTAGQDVDIHSFRASARSPTGHGDPGRVDEPAITTEAPQLDRMRAILVLGGNAPGVRTRRAVLPAVHTDNTTGRSVSPCRVRTLPGQAVTVSTAWLVGCLPWHLGVCTPVQFWSPEGPGQGQWPADRAVATAARRGENALK